MTVPADGDEMESSSDDSSAQQLRVDILRDGEDALLALSGELDISSQDVVAGALARLRRQPVDRLLLDLEPLSFMDASALELILDLQSELGDRFGVRPGQQRKLFLIAGLEELVELDPVEPELDRFAVAADNLEYVRRLYSAWESGGVEAMVGLVGNDVEWQPSQMEESVLRGAHELTDYWRRHRSPAVTGQVWFTAVGHDVMIEGEFARQDGTPTRIFALYEFAGRRLVRAVAASSALDRPSAPV